MGSHLVRFVGKEFEVKVRTLPNGTLDVGAHENLQGEPLENLPILQGEEELVNDITKFLQQHLGRVVK
jgi:hypothetical protein